MYRDFIVSGGNIIVNPTKVQLIDAGFDVSDDENGQVPEQTLDAYDIVMAEPQPTVEERLAAVEEAVVDIAAAVYSEV